MKLDDSAEGVEVPRRLKLVDLGDNACLIGSEVAERIQAKADALRVKSHFLLTRYLEQYLASIKGLQHLLK